MSGLKRQVAVRPFPLHAVRAVGVLPTLAIVTSSIALLSVVGVVRYAGVAQRREWVGCADGAPERPRAARSTGSGSDSGRAAGSCPDTVIRSTVARSVAEQWLSSWEDVACSCRIVPAFSCPGRSIGFKLYAIRPHSALAIVGLQNGDTLRRIQGVELSDPNTSLELYQRLVTERPDYVTIEATRSGCPLVIIVSSE
jgi:hypothetical protein